MARSSSLGAAVESELPCFAFELRWFAAVLNARWPVRYANQNPSLVAEELLNEVRKLQSRLAASETQYPTELMTRVASALGAAAEVLRRQDDDLQQRVTGVVNELRGISGRLEAPSLCNDAGQADSLEAPSLCKDAGQADSPSYLPSELAKELGASATTLNKYAKLARVVTPRQGQRDHRYGAEDRLRILATIDQASSDPLLVERARSLLATGNRAETKTKP